MTSSVEEVGYVEVPIRETTAPKWKELTISTGAAQSTLEDIKVSERAGGYVYREKSASTENRFIYWKTNHNVLELVEESLDVNLVGNRLRLRFQHTPLLEGISIFETKTNVVILAATVATVHRIAFPHPRKQDAGSRHRSLISSVPSIFFDASPALLRDYHVLNHVGLGLSQNSCSWLGPNGEAVFVLGTSASSLFVVSIDPFESGGKVSSMEIRRNTMLTRFLTGIIPNAMRGGSDSEDASLSLVCHQAEDDLFIFSLSRSLRLLMWSYRRQECLMAASVLDYCEGVASKWAHATGGGGPSRMYKALECRGSALYLGVYVGLPERNQFCVLRPVLQHGTYRLTHVTTAVAPESDLVDFCITTSRLWTLWVKQNYEPVVCVKSYGGGELSGWIGVRLQPVVPRDKLTIPDELDTTELYAERIFGHGGFSYSTLSKALGMYRRKGAGGRRSFSVREEAVAAVEDEIRAHVDETELEEGDFLELAASSWEKFYNNCAQYHEVGLKPLGLFVDPEGGLAAVVRRDHFSVLRPCDWHEACLLGPQRDTGPYPDCVGPLMECVREVDANLSEEALHTFAQGLYRLESPEALLDKLDLGDFARNEDFAKRLSPLLESASPLYSSLQWLLQSLEYPEKDDEKDAEEKDGRPFASGTGRSFAAYCLRQIAESRLRFTLSLLLLERLMLAAQETFREMPEVTVDVVAVASAKTSQLVRAYYTLLWATETDSSPNTGPLEGGIRQMAIGERGDGFGALAASDRCTSLAEMFLAEDRETALPQPNHGVKFELLMDYLSHSAAAMWPLSENCAFAKVLLDQGQHLQLAEYVRLLRGWCRKNEGTLKFLYASSLLACREYHKSCDLFKDVARECFLSEPYLRQKVLRGAADEEGSAKVRYFLQVAQTFERFDLPECVVTLAEAALKVAARDDDNVPALWSLLFKHRLELGHWEQAYETMKKNPDASRRADCLRRWVAVLYERRRLDVLVRVPSGNVRDEIVSIVEGRARATDLVGQRYYELLYALHIYAKKYRRAASATCEYAWRLGREVPGVESLRRRLLCLRAAVNCLLLVDPRYAWIVRPDLVRIETGRSPKRDNDGDEVRPTQKRKMDVVEISDLRKEQRLVEAWLALADGKETHVSLPMSPEETATLLVAAGRFDAAVDICQAYGLVLDPVFEGLASQCSRAPDCPEPRGMDPQWIVERPQTLLDVPGQAWSLLQNYLDRYEEESTRYHRLVASSFLARGCKLPPWFLASYKIRDAAELLRLYLMYGRLEEATDLSTEYVDAVLGKGREYFGLREALHANSSPVWLPHSTFDRLLAALRSSERHKECYGRLGTKLEEYFTVANHAMSTRMT